MSGNATNPAITPDTAHANFITVNPAVPTSVPNRTYTTIQAAVNAVPTNAYGIVWVKAGTYQENITITSRHVLLMAELGAGPVVLKPPTASGANIITINSGSQDTVLDSLITTKTMNGATQVTARSLYVSLGNANIGQHVAVNNCVFKESTYGGGNGSSTYIQSGTVWFTHSTIVDNYSVYGSNIHLESYGKIRLRNSIVWNTSDPAYTELGGANNASLADRIQVTNSIIRGGQYGANANNPLLRAVTQDIAYTTSPANNSAAPLDNGSGGTLLGASAYDLYGLPRNLITPDMGAYEYTDTDADGLVDWWETYYFGNLSQTAAADYDGEGLTNLQEYVYSYNPTLTDTDANGTNDLQQMLNSLDTDGDGMSDGFEIQYSFDLNNPNDALEDADGDRIPNVFEDRLGRTDPKNALSKPAASYTVDPAIVTETSTIKKKISTATAAYTNNTSLTWGIITAKPGVYVDTINLSKSGLLLLAENTLSPVTIMAPLSSGNLNALQVSTRNVVVDGFRITHGKGWLGRGVYIDMPTSPANPQCRIVNCQVVDNFVNSSKGAGIYVNSGILTVAYSTIAGNASTGRSHGIALQNSATCKLYLLSSIVWNVEPSGYSQYGGTPVQMEAAPSQMLGTPSQNLILGGEWSALSSAPQLDLDYNLKSSSPAINPSGSVVTSATPGYDVHGETRDTTPDYGADEFRDTDTDGLPDWWEVVYGGGLSMNPALDADSDGLTNLQEYNFTSLPTIADSDADGATDLQEYTATSNPRITDTDADGMDDGYEISNLLNPLSIMDALEDPDGDRIPNLFEYGMGKTNPRNKLIRPATSLYVDASASVETSTIKKTIPNALTAYNAATSASWHIIEVKQGFYEGQITVSKSGVLLLAEQSIRPTTINLDAIGNTISVNSANSVVLDGFRVTHTSYTKQGSGIAYSGTGAFHQFKVVNCQIVGNTPAVGYTSSTGAGIYVNYGILTVASSTFASNYSNFDGHAIFATSSAKLRLLNNIIWNVPPAGVPGTVRQVGVESSQLVGDSTKNIIKGGELGTANVDPLLDYNYRIHPGSSAINPSGSAPSEGIPTYDFNGEVRDITPDYGPDEIIDSDADGLMDSWELFYFPALTTTTATADSDLDGLANTWEEYLNFNPTLIDTNGNGHSDLQEAISLVVVLFTDATSRADQDADGLLAIQETILATSDNAIDSNGDGLNDAQIWQFGFYGTADDPDLDGLTTAQEITKGTSPFLKDTDGDGVLDGADIFPLDASRSTLSPTSGDVTAPGITLIQPANATLVP